MAEPRPFKITEEIADAILEDAATAYSEGQGGIGHKWIRFLLRLEKAFPNLKGKHFFGAPTDG